MSLFITLGLASLLAVIAVLYFRRQRATNLPPGPTPLPFIGNIPLLFMMTRGTLFRKMAKEYGDMFTLHVGSNKLISLNTYELIKESCQTRGQEFSGRPQNAVEQATGDAFPLNSGVLLSEGDVWRSNRRFSLRHLRDLGFGKQSFESCILEEVEVFLAALREKTDRPFVIRYLLGNAVSNNICKLVFGKRYEYGDERFLEFCKVLDEIGAPPKSYLIRVPYFAKLPYLRGIVKRQVSLQRFMRDVMGGHLDEHKANFDPSQTAEDLMTIYLQGKEGMLESAKGLNPVVFEDDHIAKMFFDLFLAGTETTTSAIRWALLYLVTNPDIQDKMRAEILSVVGRDRNPSLEDRARLPYTEAVLTETLRLGNVVFASVPHQTTSDIEFKGYHIPADAMIFPNLYLVHMDERNFPNPDIFRPERFIDCHGHFDKKAAEKVIPFGIGKRLCLGESLARMEFFLFLTSMIQKFEFSIPEGAPEPSFEGITLITNSPRQYELMIRNTKENMTPKT